MPKRVTSRSDLHLTNIPARVKLNNKCSRYSWPAIFWNWVGNYTKRSFHVSILWDITIYPILRSYAEQNE